MANLREQIRMSEEERLRFLEEERVVTCASLGPRGRPHLMPLWYALDGGAVLAWTYARSQKTRNLERIPQATLQVEAGRDVYEELRGVMMECDVEIVREPERVQAIGLALARRYSGIAPGSDLPEDARRAVLAQAPKRVGFRFAPTRVVSWDHRKLPAKH
jgi:PPOX class probable F420-dependent enzyme